MAAAGVGGTACGGEREAAAAASGTIGSTFVAGTPCAFSPKERRLLALSGPDGRLRVWETPSSRLQHEYVPSAHLSAACTCLAWAPPGAGGGGGGGGGRTAPGKVTGEGMALLLLLLCCGRAGPVPPSWALGASTQEGKPGAPGGRRPCLGLKEQPLRYFPCWHVRLSSGARGAAEALFGEWGSVSLACCPLSLAGWLP